jgi:hypothetical protein
MPPTGHPLAASGMVQLRSMQGNLLVVRPSSVLRIDLRE